MSLSNQNADQLAKGAGIALIGRFLGRFLSVLGDIIAARILGPAIFGLYAIGWSIFRLIELIVPLGLDMGVLRYGARYLRHDDENLKSVIVQSILTPFFFSLFLAVPFYFFAPWLAENFFNKPALVYVFRFIAVLFPLSALLSILGSALRLTQIMKYSVIVQDLGQPLFALILLGGFYFFSMRLSGVLLSDVLSYGVCVAIGFYYLWILFPSVFDFRIKGSLVSKELYTFSFVTSLAGVFATLIFWVDRLFVGYFFSAEDTGIYQAASQISVIFAVVLGGLNRIVMPMFANLFHSGKISAVEEVFQTATRWGFYLSAPILLALSIMPNESLSALYGAAYGRGAFVLQALVLGQFFNLITGPVVPLLILSGYQSDVLRLSALSLILNVAMLWFFIPRYGLSGVSVATSIALAIFFIAALIVAKRKVGVYPYDRRFLKGILAFAISAVLAFFLHGILQNLKPLLLVIIEGGFIAITFITVLFALKLDQGDKELLKSILLK